MYLELGDETSHHYRRLFACRREFEFGGKYLEEFVIGLPKDMESANEENKQFDPGGKKGEPPL